MREFPLKSLKLAIMPPVPGLVFAFTVSRMEPSAAALPPSTVFPNAYTLPVVVEFVRYTSAKCDVDDALMPACAHRVEVVAAFTTPKLLSHENVATFPVWSVAQPNVPFAHVRYCPAEQ